MLPNPLPFFEKIPDFRRETANKLHVLSEVLCIALCSIISGMDDWESVADFANSKIGWFKQFLTLENGIPSHDTFARVFSLIDPDKFEEALFLWASSANIKLDHLALDGKAIRRSHNGSAKKMAFILHAWSCSDGLLLAQKHIPEKNNEITVIDLNGTTVTIDAMGCQKSVAKKITDGGGHYVLALKGNHSNFHDDVLLFMNTLAAEQPESECCTIEKGHGRIETRRVWATNDIYWLDCLAEWQGLQSLVMVESTREIGDLTSCERRVYISSRESNANILGSYIRNHWSIENSLHWVLDVAFNEDSSRVRVGHAAENLAIIRRMALNLLKSCKESKLGVKNKRKKAGYDDDFRKLVLGW
jgi:predicted transposase YbfD/YdcC